MGGIVESTISRTPSNARRVANSLALAALLGEIFSLMSVWNAVPDLLPLKMNLASPAAVGSKTRVLIFPVIALFFYVLLTYAGRRGMLNLPDLGTPERNAHAAHQTAAALKAFSVTLIMVVQTTVLTSSPAVSANLWFSFGGLVLGLFILLLIWRRPVKPEI